LVGNPDPPDDPPLPAAGRRVRVDAQRVAALGQYAYLVRGMANRALASPVRVDLVNGEVEQLGNERGSLHGALAVAAAPDEGAVYFAGPRLGADNCTVQRLVPPAMVATEVFRSRRSCAFIAGRIDAVGMAAVGGHLYLVQEKLDAVQDINLATGTAIDLPGTSAITQPLDVAAGTDGALYVLAAGRVFRVDRTSGGAVLFAEGVTGSTLAADAHGHLFAVIGNTVASYDLASGARTTVVGRSGIADTITGPLPGALFDPSELAALPPDDLLIFDPSEHALLRARF
jgi:hypothetical protein